MKLSLFQKLAKFLLSQSTFEKVMQESKRHRFICSACRKESSIWDVGGIRFKAAGKPKIGIRCPHCHKYGMQTIEKS